jgi:hypothetical protein
MPVGERRAGARTRPEENVTENSVSRRTLLAGLGRAAALMVVASGQAAASLERYVRRGRGRGGDNRDEHERKESGWEESGWEESGWEERG